MGENRWLGSSIEMPVVYSIVVVMLGKLGDGLGEEDMG